MGLRQSSSSRTVGRRVADAYVGIDALRPEAAVRSSSPKSAGGRTEELTRRRARLPRGPARLVAR